ncbi:F-type H+-transporting ATPase subunit b [Ruminococcaceae bacterium YRB3002]|nr:F-type H+-transporting ATPase subunit b [Ruminococcaceae bacterium YRB3002]
MFDMDVIEVALDTESSLLSPDQMAGYAVTAIFVVINVIVAFIIIKRFIFKPLFKMIKKRQDALNSELDAAENKNKEADTYVSESKKAVEDARIKASGIIEEARENAEKQADNIVKKAREDAAEILARAEEDAARMKKAAVDELKDDISDLAVKVAERVLGDVVPKATLADAAKKYTDEVVRAEVKADE